MHKAIIILTVIFICICSFLGLQLLEDKTQENEVQKNNQEYEYYASKNLTAADIATLINKAINNNKYFKVPKGSDNKYENDNNFSISIEIRIADNNTIYAMEAIYNVGIERFIQNFNTENFKCTKIEYHKTTNRIRYILLEQIS